MSTNLFYLSFHKLSREKERPETSCLSYFPTLLIIKYKSWLIKICFYLFSINYHSNAKFSVSTLVIVLQSFFINKKQKLFIESFFSINCQQAIKSAVTALVVVLSETLKNQKRLSTSFYLSFHKLSTELKIECNDVGYRITDEKDNQIESVLILFVWLHLTFIEQIKFVFYLCNFTKKERHT